MIQSSLSQPLVLTLALDAVSFGIFDALRKEHFPRERNWIPAHLTLFHALPGEEEGCIAHVLETECQTWSPIQFLISGVRFLGKGVAYEVQSQELENLRMRLAHQWKVWLTPQDRQGFRPHITIQNKVSPEVTRALHERLSQEFVPWEAQGEGLLLWRYMGGPWELVRELSFVSGEMPRSGRSVADK